MLTSREEAGGRGRVRARQRLTASQRASAEKYGTMLKEVITIIKDVTSLLPSLCIHPFLEEEEEDEEEGAVTDVWQLQKGLRGNRCRSSELPRSDKSGRGGATCLRLVLTQRDSSRQTLSSWRLCEVRPCLQLNPSTFVVASYWCVFHWKLLWSRQMMG